MRVGLLTLWASIKRNTPDTLPTAMRLAVGLIANEVSCDEEWKLIFDTWAWELCPFKA